jgi:hypothetical protein
VRFDAYHGNVWQGSFQEVAECVAAQMKCRLDRGKSRSRYGLVLDVLDGLDPVGWVADDSANGTAYFEFKGQRTPDAASAIRAAWPGATHNVSRADVCEDYCEPGAHSRLVSLVDRAKQDPRVQSDAITPRDGDRGETVYWGSRKSPLLVRVYEKGKQKENIHLGRPDWARLELQCRPAKSDQKQLASMLRPIDFWGFGRWTRNVAEAATSTPIERFAAPNSPRQFDQKTYYLATANRRLLQELLETFGDAECVFREFRSMWAHQDALKAQSVQRRESDQAGAGAVPQ